MADLASEVKFASELNDERTLDEVIQRELKESRSNKLFVIFKEMMKDFLQ